MTPRPIFEGKKLRFDQTDIGISSASPPQHAFTRDTVIARSASLLITTVRFDGHRNKARQPGGRSQRHQSSPSNRWRRMVCPSHARKSDHRPTSFARRSRSVCVGFSPAPATDSVCQPLGPSLYVKS